jgi:tRNA threonylcarbamoyladenosine biosynthesis protein TsaE
MKTISENLEDTSKVAKGLIKLICEKEFTKSCVIGLYGDLGAGKTTLTQALGKELGIQAPVISPTFVIMKSYALQDSRFKKLVHIDAYRLDSSSELSKLGWADIISDPENLVLIEWPERVSDIMPKGHIKIKIGHLDENSREIEID